MHQANFDRPVGVSLRWFVFKHYPPDVAGNYLNVVAAWMSEIHREYKSQFVFFPFCTESEQTDIKAFRTVRSGLGIKNFPLSLVIPTGFSNLRESIGRCGAFLGTRYHSVLLAVQQKVPVLALSYDQKTEKFMKQAGLDEFFIKVEDMTLNLLMEKWRKLILAKKELIQAYSGICREQRRLALRHIDLVEQAVLGKKPLA
ncbi:MAG: polysaccharide pyruvyl transferase family protein [Candidatus Aminicenantes bacterium]|nr:polysaccharide pyruvyl transferase family protein [Candidatus Aminicenantes bacterium]